MGPHNLLVVVLLGLLSLVSAFTGDVEKRSFKVSQVRNANFVGRNGPKELAKAYRKYRVPVPDNLAKAAAFQEARLKKRSLELQKRRVEYLAPTSKASPFRPVRGSSAARRSVAGLVGWGSSTFGRVSVPVANEGDRTVWSRQQKQRNQTGQVVAAPERNDVEYLSKVRIGGQEVTLDFDSGSSDLWVKSVNPSDTDPNSRASFDPRKSKTFKIQQGQNFTISYGDGSGARGLVGTDVVEIGGVKVENQAVELATEITQQFVDDVNTDGLLGLAFSQLNAVKPQKQKTFFDNVASSLEAPVIFVDLKKGQNGSYTFGKIDNSVVDGQMTYVPCNTTKGFWAVKSDSFSVGNGPRQNAAPGTHAVVDTGTTITLSAPEVAEAYYKQVRGAQFNQQQGGFTFPCNSTLPELHLDINGLYNATVKGENMNLGDVGDGSKSPAGLKSGLLI
ncbi:Aspergillopepsin I [Purpureocillium takamizusanense]|uniref:Aspergillopepsin I n=1 Tax=Purpureocillium takamizusanense TaxID=2060973 RepID=A0A9Q8Q968_9HYPO|nr:Aspergillopepsin I [Purpureocillium takamizusanense]UNI15878.1 Aspergillopepsin I [Purpureocillium takamizusanense]